MPVRKGLQVQTRRTADKPMRWRARCRATMQMSQKFDLRCRENFAVGSMRSVAKPDRAIPLYLRMQAMTRSFCSAPDSSDRVRCPHHTRSAVPCVGC